MTSPRVIYFGVSSQKSATEVGGWSNVGQMGLKDAVTYDTTTRKYDQYTKSQITALIDHLQTADLIVGFNQLQFDYKILSAYTDTNLDALPNFDILSKIERTLNFRVSRDNLSQNTLGESKHSKGRSSLGKRIDTTKKLFAHGCKEGYLSYRNNRFGTKEVCDTSSWANTARNITQSKQPSEQDLDKNSVGKEIPEEVLRIYDMAKNQHHHSSALHTYNEMIENNLLAPAIPSDQVNVAIVGQSLNRNPHKSNYKNGNSRFYYFDRSYTFASERVNDYRDMRNIREELARGI